jgi:lysophospholipase L1-like esterase
VTGAFLAGVLITSLLTACGTVPVPDRSTSAPTSAPTSGAGVGSTAPAQPTSSSTPRSHVLVVGLGDSVTSGEHCACADYVTGFGRLVAARDRVRVQITNDGDSGATSDDLDNRLGEDRDLRSDVAHADVVVLTMGANDLGPALRAWRSGSCEASCYEPEVTQMRQDLNRVLGTVGGLTGGRARVLVTTYWNVFADGDVARTAERAGYLAWSDTVTRRANAVITQVAANHGATLVDLYAPFKADGDHDTTGLLAADGDHPDPAGTAVISRAVLAAYEASR